jgi:hypothetical protein
MKSKEESEVKLDLKGVGKEEESEQSEEEEEEEDDVIDIDMEEEEVKKPEVVQSPQMEKPLSNKSKNDLAESAIVSGKRQDTSNHKKEKETKKNYNFQVNNSTAFGKVFLNTQPNNDENFLKSNDNKSALTLIAEKYAEKYSKPNRGYEKVSMYEFLLHEEHINKFMNKFVIHCLILDNWQQR